MKNIFFKLVLVVIMSLSLGAFDAAFSQTATIEETISISTYYPSPMGVYKELRSQRMAIGDNYYGSDYCWGGVCTNPIGNATSLVVEGNVGIGMTAPSSRLVVRQETNSVSTDISTRLAAFTLTAKDGDEAVSLELFGYPASTEPYLDNTVMLYAPQGGQADNLQIAVADSAGTIRFHTTGWQTAATERMRIAANGNVGIGTTIPQAKVDVAGEIKVGNSGLACNANTTGALRYNSTIQYCDGTNWVVYGAGPKIVSGHYYLDLNCDECDAVVTVNTLEWSYNLTASKPNKTTIHNFNVTYAGAPPAINNIRTVYAAMSSAVDPGYSDTCGIDTWQKIKSANSFEVHTYRCSKQHFQPFWIDFLAVGD